MKSIAIESEHWTLLAGLLFILIGLFIPQSFNLGIIICILSYAIDLLKRIKEIDL